VINLRQEKKNIKYKTTARPRTRRLSKARREPLEIDLRPALWYKKAMYRTRIFYQDTDAGGVVYFANYLTFFEKSWFEFLASIGIHLADWEARDTFLMVKTAVLNLKGKVRYGDSIHVITSVTAVKNASFMLFHRVLCGEETTTEGETEMVCVDGTGKPRRLPSEFRDRLLGHLEEKAARRP
jgi:acyl-CoA thioester hydrolase